MMPLQVNAPFNLSLDHLLCTHKSRRYYDPPPTPPAIPSYKPLVRWAAVPTHRGRPTPLYLPNHDGSGSSLAWQLALQGLT